jgi:histone H3/H4
MKELREMSKEQHIDQQSGRIKKSTTTGRKRRHKSGEKALKEIKFYQKNPGLIIPVAAVRRGVRGALQKAKPGGARITQVAFDTIHELLEEYIVRVFSVAQIMAIHAKRKTVMPPDMINLFKVCNAMAGKNDLSGEPINAKMSEAHHRNKRKKPETTRQKKEKTDTIPPEEQHEQPKKKKRREKRKHKEVEVMEEDNVDAGPQEDPILPIEIEVEEEERIPFYIMNNPVIQSDYNDDWCLEEC